MAEIENNISSLRKNNTGVKKGKKLSTRVDLTPMVDLGFLLITFFIFTTTMVQPTALRLFLPQDTKNTKVMQPVKASGALTLLLAENDVVFYYEGPPVADAAVQRTTFKYLRDVITSKQQHTNPKDLYVIIKPCKGSTYGNAVNALDEMTINDVKHYAMIDVSPEDVKMMAYAEPVQRRK